MTTPPAAVLEISPDAEALAVRIAAEFSATVAAWQSTGRTPRVALTGGTIATAAYRLLGQPSSAGCQPVDWTQVDFWWGDERFVPAGHTDRNDAQAAGAFLDRLGVPVTRRHAFGAHDCAWSAREAAEAYVATLPAEGFDLVLLGLGPDGHVASLFPHHPATRVSDRPVVEVFDAPKPPPVRLSLTFGTLNHAAEVWFLVAGAEKAVALHEARGAGDRVAIPGRGVRGQTTTRWLVDQAAASGSVRANEGPA